jgi:hypothetical protein
MSGFKDELEDVFDQVKTDLEKVNGLTVILGGPMRLGVNLPQAIVNPLPSPMRRSHDAGGIEAMLTFEVVLVIQEAEPANWFDEIIDVMGDALDKILQDSTLSGEVDDCWPTMFSPAAIRFTSKLYYGGVIRFQARLLYG